MHILMGQFAHSINAMGIYQYKLKIHFHYYNFLKFVQFKKYINGILSAIAHMKISMVVYECYECKVSRPKTNNFLKPTLCTICIHLEALGASRLGTQCWFQGSLPYKHFDTQETQQVCKVPAQQSPLCTATIYLQHLCTKSKILLLAITRENIIRQSGLLFIPQVHHSFIICALSRNIFRQLAIIAHESSSYNKIYTILSIYASYTKHGSLLDVRVEVVGGFPHSYLGCSIGSMNSAKDLEIRDSNLRPYGFLLKQIRFTTRPVVEVGEADSVSFCNRTPLFGS